MSYLELCFEVSYKILKWYYWYLQNEDSIAPAVKWLKFKFN